MMVQLPLCLSLVSCPKPHSQVYYLVVGPITPDPFVRILAWMLASAPPMPLSLNCPSPCILCTGIGLSEHVPPQPTNLHTSTAGTITSPQEMRLQTAAHGILGI